MLKNFCKEDYSFLFLIFLFIITVFFKIIFLGLTFFGGDSTLQVFPVRMYIADMLKNKIFPLWTPDIFCGYPLFAGGETGVLFPFNLLFSIFPSVFTFNIFFIVLPIFLGSFFIYCFCKLLLLDRFSSFVSSISYFFSGVMFFFLCNPFAFCIFSLLPLKLIFLELSIKKNNISYLVFIIFILSVQFLGGNPQAVFISFLGVVFYSFYRIYICKEGTFFKWIFILIFLGSLSILLSSIQIIPTFELYKFTRGNIKPSFEFMTELSVSPKLLLACFFHFGYMGEYGIEIQDLGYMDILPFILVLFFKKNRLTKFLVISFFICVILSLGKYNPLYRLFFYIPIFNQMRYPVLFLLIGYFWLSLLAGVSLNNILKIEKGDKKKMFNLSFVIVIAVYILLIIFSVFCYREENYISNFLTYFLKEAKVFIILSSIVFILLILYFADKITSIWFKRLLTGYIFCTLFLTPPYLLEYLPHANYVELLENKDIDKSLFITSADIYPESPGYVEFLKKDNDLYRVYNDYKESPLQRSLGLLYKIPCVFGYLPLHYARFERYLNLLNEDIYVHGLDLMNVKYILDEKIENIPVGTENEREKLVYNQEISIIENKKCLPRSFFVYKYLVIKKEDEILEKLNDKNFNLLEYVILEEIPNVQSTPLEQITNQQPPSSKINILKYKPREIIIRANSDKDGFLFLGDVYYPGWEVYVNNKKDKIYRANYLFRAVYLKKGENEVRFLYKPTSFKIGLLISIFTFFVLVGFMLCYAKIKKV